MKTKTILQTLAAALLMPTMLLTTACSNNDDEIVNTENPTNTKGYALPVTVNVTRQGGDATRAIYDESTKKLSFSTGDKLFIEDYQKFAGILTMVSDGKFSGEILTKTPYTGTVEELFASASELRAYLLPAGYEEYGFLNIANKDTYQAYLYYSNSKVFALTKKEAVEQLSLEKHWYYDTSIKGFELMPSTAILNFTISGLAANTEVAVCFKYTDDEDATPVNITTDASGVATFAAAMYNEDNFDDYSLTVGGNAIALPADKEVEAGKIYNISRSVAPVPTARALAEATAADLGKIAGADGNIYDSKDAASTAGTTAVAMIAYVGSGTEHATYTHGLAIALADESSSNWSTAKSTCEGKAAVTNAAWLLPSQNQWKAMFKAFGGKDTNYTGLNNALAAAGGNSSKLQNGSDDYLSSTPLLTSFAIALRLIGDDHRWVGVNVNQIGRVRACLAF